MWYRIFHNLPHYIFPVSSSRTTPILLRTQHISWKIPQPSYNHSFFCFLFVRFSNCPCCFLLGKWGCILQNLGCHLHFQSLRQKSLWVPIMGQAQTSGWRRNNNYSPLCPQGHYRREKETSTLKNKMQCFRCNHWGKHRRYLEDRSVHLAPV